MDEGPVPAGFENLPGSIGIAFIYWEGGANHSMYVRYVGGRVEHPDRLPKPHYKTARRDRTGPVASSPDGRYLAKGIDSPGTWNIAPVLVVVDLKSDKEVFRIDSNDAWGIQGLAWSPNGDEVAVLKSESTFGKTPLEWISHPNQLDTYYLDIVKLDGTVAASTKLASRVSSLRGTVIWTK